jgi:hypothetical protein
MKRRNVNAKKQARHRLELIVIHFFLPSITFQQKKMNQNEKPFKMKGIPFWIENKRKGTV